MTNRSDRDCNSCIHHIQAGGFDGADPECWGCLSSFVRTGVELPRWQQQVRRGTRKELEEDSQKLREEVAYQKAMLSGTLTAESLKGDKQSRKASLLEASLNTASGFILSYLVWILVATPLFNIPVNYTDTFWITVLFTGVSLVRSYVWRRLFNNNFGREANGV